MRRVLLYPVGNGLPCTRAAKVLQSHNIPLIDHPSPDITHLLLDVPSFTDDGKLHGCKDAKLLLSMLPPSVTVIGGNLEHPILNGYSVLDLLQSEEYLCRNAAITAHCAVKAALPHLSRTLSDCQCVIIGWGRIGKCLASLLRKLGSDVTLVIRNPKDLALARALGYRACSCRKQDLLPAGIPLIFNTVPEKVLSDEVQRRFADCVKIDLASRPGLCSEDVIHARGLPGKLAPESSGNLIAECILSYLKEE